MSQLKDFYFRIPKRLIYISLMIAMVLDFIPISGSMPWLPNATLLMLIYWLANCPHYINLGTSFCLGLVVDIGTGSPLGGHALAYILAAYLIIVNHRQFGIQNYGFQAVLVWIALIISETILVLVQIISKNYFSGWLVWLAPFVGALLWPFLSRFMNVFLQSQRLR